MSHNPYHKDDTLMRGWSPVQQAEQANEFARFFKEQGEWSNFTFGPELERGPLGPLKHLEKEAKEAQAEVEKINAMSGKFDGLVEAYKALKEEIADCLFLTLDAARRAGMSDKELLQIAFQKLEKNKARKWQKPTSDEPVEHVRDEAED